MKQFNHIPQFENEGSYLILHCPHCGCGQIHQTTTEVFCREEDKPARQVIIESSGNVTNLEPGEAISVCPSDRRNGMSLHFRCEQCFYLPVLHIYQHKGDTRIEFGANSKYDRETEKQENEREEIEQRVWFWETYNEDMEDREENELPICSFQAWAENYINNRSCEKMKESYKRYFKDFPFNEFEDFANATEVTDFSDFEKHPDQTYEETDAPIEYLPTPKPPKKEKYKLSHHRGWKPEYEIRAKILQQRNFKTYAEYLKSPHWKKVSKKKKKKLKTCQMCKQKSKLFVHHLTYSTLGKERLKDLQVLCENCHFDEHMNPPLSWKPTAADIKEYEIECILNSGEFLEN